MFRVLITNETIKSYIEILAPGLEASSGGCVFYELNYDPIKNKLEEIKQLVEKEEKWEKQKTIAIRAGIFLVILTGLGVYFWRDIKDIYKNKISIMAQQVGL
jgi:hypothetical protein